MPDITNDFDNNLNTDKRKQRDEEVNNDNLQPEQTKSEPELLDQTKSKYRFLQSCMTGAISKLMSLI